MSDLNPLNWNWNQYKAAGKHVASYAAGGISVAVALHFISPGQATDISENIGHVTTGINELVKGLSGLLATGTLLYTSLRAAHNASPSSQVTSVVANLSAPQITQAANAVADPTSRAKLIEAVAEMPEVKKIVPVDPALAIATASPKVVTQ
ncbi:MAG: hypothetical protein ABIO35_08330 [Nitrobacter sp.]